MLWALKRTDGSFKYPKQKFKLMGKEIMAILGKENLLIWPYGGQSLRFLSSPFEPALKTMFGHYIIV